MKSIEEALRELSNKWRIWSDELLKNGQPEAARISLADANELDALLSQAPADTPPKDEVGWVVEKRGILPVEYVCAWSGGFEFTTDNLKAIRFCRREDANQIAEILDSEDVAIVEHMWCKP